MGPEKKAGIEIVERGISVRRSPPLIDGIASNTDLQYSGEVFSCRLRDFRLSVFVHRVSRWLELRQQLLPYGNDRIGS